MSLCFINYAVFKSALVLSHIKRCSFWFFFFFWHTLTIEMCKQVNGLIFMATSHSQSSVCIQNWNHHGSFTLEKDKAHLSETSQHLSTWELSNSGLEKIVIASHFTEQNWKQKCVHHLWFNYIFHLFTLISNDFQIDGQSGATWSFWRMV